MTNTDKRGELVALVGAALSLSIGVALAVLAVKSGSGAAWAACFQSIGTLGVWIISLIQLHQRRLVAEERLELAAIERERQEKLRGATPIFDEEDLDQLDKLAMGRRLRSIERFLVPIAAVLLSLCHVAAGASIFPWRFQFPPLAAAGEVAILHPAVLIFFCGAIAFTAFMVSRYALGMSRIAPWELLRSGGNYMFGASIANLAIALGLLCVISGLDRVEPWVARGIGVLLMWLGVETIINLVLDFYRPRVPGQAHRPFYDSRLLGMFSEPAGILRSLANTIDYQFGFKVSDTWFFKLMGRVVVPLLFVQVLVILALTCIVVVPPGHQAVVERLGALRPETAKPGIHLTWPWPLDRATIIPVSRIRRMEIGYKAADQDEDERRTAASGVILWTVRHYREEHKLVVADRAASATTKVPINLLSVNMPVQWRVRDADDEVVRFHSQTQVAEKIIEATAYRELTKYAAENDAADLLGKGGIETSRELHRRIQSACDRGGYDGKGLGVEIVLVGIGGVHPPPDDDVAKAYEDVVSAIETRDATIKGAQGDAARTRVESAGDLWKQLYDAIALEDRLQAEGSPRLAEQTREVERLLREAVGGKARQRSANAVRRAYERLFEQKSAAERYDIQLAAYRAAPEIYTLRVYLRALEEGLVNVRKYVIALARPENVVYDVDLRPTQQLDLLATEAAALERKQPGI